MKLDKKTQGYLMIFAAFICFAIGTIAKNPLVLEHKILVATKDVEGDIFKGSVIFILHHNVGGAHGVILNKKQDGKAVGGPVEPGNIVVLHSDEVSLPESHCMKDTGICYVEGSYAVKALADMPKKPAWQMTLNGYSGWGFRQLEKEIKKNYWKAVDFDGQIVTQTSPGKMWAAANKLPAAKLN